MLDDDDLPPLVLRQGMWLQWRHDEFVWVRWVLSVGDEVRCREYAPGWDCSKKLSEPAEHFTSESWQEITAEEAHRLVGTVMAQDDALDARAEHEGMLRQLAEQLGKFLHTHYDGDGVAIVTEGGAEYKLVYTSATGFIATRS